MGNVNHKKVIVITLFKILLMILTFFTINNWPHIKQSFNGQVPDFQLWLDHSFTLSNLIIIVLISVVFYMNTLKHHKELAEKRSTHTEI